MLWVLIFKVEEVMNQTILAYLQHLVICSTQSPYAAYILEDATYPVIIKALFVYKNSAY